MLTRCLKHIIVVVLLLVSYQARAELDYGSGNNITLQLDSRHQFSHAGYYVALDKGFYQNVGLKVTFKIPSEVNFDPVDSLLTQQATMTITGSSLVKHLNDHANLRVLATIEQFSPWALLTRPNVTLESLRGKSIAISHQASEIHTMLHRAGLSPTDYRTLPSGNLKLFNNQEIAAIAIKITDLPHVSPHLTSAYELINSRAIGLNFYGASIITTKEYLENHQRQASLFKAATLKGWQYAIDNPQYAAQLIKSKYDHTLSVNSLLVEARQLIYLMQPNLLAIGNSTSMRWLQIAEDFKLTNTEQVTASLVFAPVQNGFVLSHLFIVIGSSLLAFTIIVPGSLLWRAKHNANKKMRLINSILKTQQQASIDGILIFDAQGKLVSVNKQLKQLWKLSETKSDRGNTWQMLYVMARQVANTKEFITSVRMHNADSNMQSFSEITLRDGRTFERFSAPLFDEQKEFVGRFWSFRDITQRKLAEENIWLQANFDSLTDLPNRLMFKERLTFEIKKTTRTGKQVALLFLDLDRFKEINDSMGHDVGDQLLIEVASRLKKCVRDIDMVARLGGDEFTIILSDLEDISVIDRICRSILTSLATPFELNGQPHYISTSIGITFSPSDGVDDVQLLKNADQAMYHAKELGRNNFQYFTQALQTKASKRVSLSNELRQAIDNQQLFLEYQPIMSLDNNKIVKAEALLRWNHPELGLIPPSDFIELAEETGLINNIGEWVFEQAAKQVQIFQRIEPNFAIAVNTSPVQYHSGTIDPKRWQQKLAKLNLSTQAITVELTETLLLESNNYTMQALQDFKTYQMPIALDDFGTGYSSMSYLNKFDIDYLKIDRSFVSDLSPDSKEVALCQAIITMAKSLGMTIIAEGIETQEQQQLLIQMGCHFGQGYHLAKPMRASALNQLLTAQIETEII